MKNLLILFLIITSSSVIAQTNDAAIETAKEAIEYYGEKITKEGAIDMASLSARMNEVDSMHCKVKGEIMTTCAKKGCWMTIKSENGEDMRVSFKDYGFFVPVSEQEGKTAIMRGKAFIETTSVKMLRHFAEDAGKSKEEIEAITEPITNLTFEADGVLIIQ